MNSIKNNRKLPKFIYVGTGKAGTTWLFKILKRHSGLCMANCKETNFFDLNYFKGLSWYQSFFEHASEGSLIGEVSHRYIHDPDVARRIRSDLGDIKIIVGLRHPVDYCMSDYLYTRRNGRFVGSFDDWCVSGFDWATVDYRLMLEPYFREFPRENLKIYDFEDLKCKPQLFVDDLLKFLDVELIRLSGDDLVPVNATAQARNVFVAKYVNIASKFLKRRGGQRLIAKVKYSPFVQKVLYKELKEKPVISDNLSEVIIGRVADGLDWLKKYCDFEFRVKRSFKF